jgi:hypothetical protein
MRASISGPGKREIDRASPCDAPILVVRTRETPASGAQGLQPGGDRRTILIPRMTGA